MTATKIYYSVENCGDGSAYPRFFLDERLAQWHQDSLEERWGEDCIGSITFNHNGPIEISPILTIFDLVNSCWEKRKAKKLITLINNLIVSEVDKEEINRLADLKTKLSNIK